jgi:hypothetical protein
MNRLPVYAEDKRYRICSMPNGMWQHQFHDGSKGSNRMKATKIAYAQDHNDPWNPIGSDTDFTTARRKLGGN